MFLIVNLFIALSFGVHLEQLEHRMGLTCPLPFLLRPLFHACQPTRHDSVLFGVRGSYFDARFFTMIGDLEVFSCCIALREVSMLLSVDGNNVSDVS